jgi:hypothetical protein
VRERREMRIGVGWVHLNIRIRLEDLGVDGRIILKKPNIQHIALNRDNDVSTSET